MKKKGLVASTIIADAIGIDRSTMSRMITRGQIKGVVRQGRTWFFYTSDIIHALENIPSKEEKTPLFDQEPVFILTGTGVTIDEAKMEQAKETKPDPFSSFLEKLGNLVAEASKEAAR